MSRVFEHFPATGLSKCPVCDGNHDGPTILIPIYGTEDGNNMEAVPAHIDCVMDNLTYSKEHKLIGMQTQN
jgi:hypothetical protein